MKKRFLAFLFLILLALSAYDAYSHENEEKYTINAFDIYQFSQLTVVGYGSLVFGILIILIIFFHKIMNETVKKIVYLLVVAVISIVTLYIVITTLHINIFSATKGPVHWHADFEIWVCDREVRIKDPEGLSNKQGVNLIHAHNDNRIHVEGVLLDKKQASLGAFFYAVHGSLLDDGMKIPTNNGLAAVHNGDKCNGKPAKLYVFVNGNLTVNPSAYVISPYEKVPPGDIIKIVFTEKPLEEINPNVYYQVGNHKE